MPGMHPAQQSLGANQPAAIDLRLIVEQKLVRLYPLAMVFLHCSAGMDGGLQGRGEKTYRVAACRLGLIQGNISLL